MKKNTIIEIISALFILLFVYTGLNKFIGIGTLQHVLKGYPLIGKISNSVAWGLPIIEFSVAALLFVPKTRLVGLYGALALMSCFTLYLAYMLLFTTKHVCTCGGMLQKLTWPQHMVFNILFILLAITALRIKRRIGQQLPEKLPQEVAYT